MAALALLLTLATMYWCLRLLKRQNTKADRYLMGLVGLVATYQGLRILSESGFWSLSATLHGFSGFVDAIIAGLYLSATLILQVSNRDKRSKEIHLRVVEADQPAVRPATAMPQIPERTAIAVLGVNSKGEIDMWHTSSEDFFGWRKGEVMGTTLPFREAVQFSENTSGVPRMLSLKTKRDEAVEALVWTMPVPGELSSLVLVLDYRKSKKADVADRLEPASSRQLAAAQA